MLIGLWNYHEIHHENNFMLTPDTSSCLGEDVLRSFYEFYLESKLNNHKLEILNKYRNYKEYDAFIFFNYPNSKKSFVLDALNSSKKKYLLNLECPTVYPQTWDKEIFQRFDKIFTWDDSLIDNSKFFKINNPSYPLEKIETLPKNLKKKFSVIVGSNKSSDNINDLYHKRLEIIQWYEKNEVNDLDFFGYGWDKYVFNGSKIIRAFNKFNFLTKFLAPKFKNYQGSFDGKKVDLLKEYKFSYCIENAKGYQGYITEKIFHCFFALTIPVYLGCPNITNHIPKECFIDMRDFNSVKDIHFFLKNMPNDKFMNYQKSIKDFLNSDKFIPFSNKYYVEILKNNILFN